MSRPRFVVVGSFFWRAPDRELPTLRSLATGIIIGSLLLALGSTRAMAEKNRAQIKDGFYISLGVGAASGDGIRGVEMDFTDGGRGSTPMEWRWRCPGRVGSRA